MFLPCYIEYNMINTIRPGTTKDFTSDSMSCHVISCYTYFKLAAGINVEQKTQKKVFYWKQILFYPGGLNKLLTGDRLILWQNTQCGSAHLLQYCIYPKLHQVIHPVHQQLQVNCREKQTKQKTEFCLFVCFDVWQHALWCWGTKKKNIAL